MRILLLSTWFPYPLSQGSKIRAYYLIRSLAQENEVALISFKDVAVRPKWIEHMRGICQSVEVVSNNPFMYNRLRTWSGWFSSQPSSIKASHSPEMVIRIKKLASEWGPELIVALTFVTAAYALEITGIPRVVDVDNLMAQMLYEDYLQAKTLAKRIRLWLAWTKFRNYERWLYPKFDLSLVTSEQDRRAIHHYVSLKKHQVGVVPNGVDTNLNVPGLSKPRPNHLVFNGSLTYHSNFDAIFYFLQEIFPLICDQEPEVKLVITGKTQGVPFDKLPSNGNVFFSGYLEDIRPTVAASWACVVPLRKGGGTRLKILEAMALGTPVVSTSKGAEGLEVGAGRHILIADDPKEFANQTVRLLNDPTLRNYLSVNAEKLVKEKYGWDQIGKHFLSMVNNITVS